MGTEVWSLTVPMWFRKLQPKAKITDFINHVFATGSQFDLQSSLSSLLLLFGGDLKKYPINENIIQKLQI